MKNRVRLSFRLERDFVFGVVLALAAPIAPAHHQLIFEIGEERGGDDDDDDDN